MAYTTINKSSEHFNTKLYTGNATDNTAITGVGFQPDFTWIKARSINYSHNAQDAVRGAGKRLEPDQTYAEGTYPSFKSFDTDGFTLGTSAGVNDNGQTFASWNWKANGTGSSNTDGTITSTVSANTTNGFSMSKYTGTGANASFGHGLGTTPAVYIIKRLTGAAGTWLMYHQSLGIGYHLGLNNTSAQNANDATFANNTAPDTSKIYLGSWGDLNANGSDFICYSFAEKQGYSKFGSYTGNGNADGTFVYTGFKPSFFLVKRTDSTSSWTMLDNKRDPFNVTTERLFPNESVAASVGTNANTDFLSNGVKIRVNHGNFNASGGSYIYMAFAEAPLVGTNNVPATAR